MGLASNEKKARSMSDQAADRDVFLWENKKTFNLFKQKKTIKIKSRNEKDGHSFGTYQFEQY